MEEVIIDNEALLIVDPTTPKSFSQVVLSSRIPEKEDLAKLLNYFSSNGGELVPNGASGNEIVDIQAEITMIRGLNKFVFRGHIMTKTKASLAIVPLVDLIYDTFIANKEELANKNWIQLQIEIMGFLREHCLKQAALYSKTDEQ